MANLLQAFFIFTPTSTNINTSTTYSLYLLYIFFFFIIFFFFFFSPDVLIFFFQTLGGRQDVYGREAVGGGLRRVLYGLPILPGIGQQTSQRRPQVSNFRKYNTKLCESKYSIVE
jgi:hypothetical protein